MKKQFFIFAALIIISIVHFIYWPKDDSYFQNVYGEEQVFNIRIDKEPEINRFNLYLVGTILKYCRNEDCLDTGYHDGYQVEFSITQNKLDKTNFHLEDIRLGDVLILEGIMSKTTISIDDLNQAYQNQESEYSDLLKKKNINYQKNKIFSKIKVLKIVGIQTDREKKFHRWLIEFRKKIESNISYVIDQPESDLANGLIVSGKDSLSKDILDEFKRVGLIHIVVLSGSNVSIISQALFKMLAFLPLIVQTAVGIFCMIGFAIMTGGSPPVVRSVFMSSTPLIITQLQNIYQVFISHSDSKSKEKSRKRYSTLSVLIFVALIMSAINPLLPLYDISFQLSFLATFGLIVLSRPIEKYLMFLPSRFGIRDIVATSLATQVYISPLLLYMSGNLSSVFLIANIIVLPLLPFIMLILFLIPFTSFIAPIISNVLGIVSYHILHIVMLFIHWLASLPFAFIEIGSLSGINTIWTYIIIFSITTVALMRARKCPPVSR